MRPGARLSAARRDSGAFTRDLPRRSLVEARRIGQVAEGALLEASAIRFYESPGVLPIPDRNAAGIPCLHETDVGLMRFVRPPAAAEQSASGPLPRRGAKRWGENKRSVRANAVQVELTRTARVLGIRRGAVGVDYRVTWTGASQSRSFIAGADRKSVV